jgi:hypothetical protein
MKQQIDSRVAEMHLKLTNVVLDEMDRQVDKIKLFKDQPDSTHGCLGEYDVPFAGLFFLMYEFGGYVRVE